MGTVTRGQGWEELEVGSRELGLGADVDFRTQFLLPISNPQPPTANRSRIPFAQTVSATDGQGRAPLRLLARFLLHEAAVEPGHAEEGGGDGGAGDDASDEVMHVVQDDVSGREH